MSDHDFEKQVHQKLEELKLRPSDTVWMEVEKNIRKDKRRRRFLWLWVPMLFICITTSGYILYRLTLNEEKTTGMAQAIPTSSSNTHTAETLNTTNKQATTIQPAPDNDGQAGKNTTASSSQQTDRKQPAISTPAAAHETTPVSVLSNEEQPQAIAVTEKNKEEKTIGNNNKRPVRKPLVFDDYETGQLVTQKPLANAVIDNMPAPGENNTNLFTREKPRYRKKKTARNTIVLKEGLVTQEPFVPADNLKPERDAMDVTMPVIVNDIDNTIATNKTVTTPFNSKAIFLMIPDSGSNTTATAVPIDRKRPVLWHWGIVTNAGFSRIAESKLLQLKGLLGQQKSTADDRVYSSPTAGSNSLINFTTSTTAKKASPIQPDISFSAGVFVQRALSPRFKLSLGLEYTYMSVNTQVGQKVNSPLVINTDTLSAKIVPEYYKSPGYSPASADATLTQNAGANYQVYYSNKYRYRFQYIEIPLLANWQINKGRRLPPIVFEGGVSISRLLSVDALHFEGVKGVYYQDKDLFNKTQFNFVTGLNVGLLQKSKHPIWIGPTLRYALNGLIKKDASTGQYMWSTGISVKMLLGRL